MRSDTKTKTVHYKNAVITNTPETLQELLKTALDKSGSIPKAFDREETIGLDDSNRRLINRHTSQNGMFFGQLVLFESGRGQPLIELNINTEFYQINSITTEFLKEGIKDTSNDVSKREFIDSILYFGVLDNHVMVLPSNALKARDLETHLNWLLTSRTNTLHEHSILHLQDKPTEETISKIMRSPVQKIVLGSKIETYGELDKERALKWKPKGIGASILEAIAGHSWGKTVRLNDCLDESNLKVHLVVSYSRKTNTSGQKVLDSIATSLRNSDEDDLLIKLHGGGTIKGKDLKLSGNLSVKTISGLIDESDLYLRMSEWFMSKVKSNELELDFNDD